MQTQGDLLSEVWLQAADLASLLHVTPRPLPAGPARGASPTSVRPRPLVSIAATTAVTSSSWSTSVTSSSSPQANCWPGTSASRRAGAVAADPLLQPREWGRCAGGPSRGYSPA